MLPALPTPGTTWFGNLSKALVAHGMSASNTEMEAPSNVLNDVILKLSLMRDRLKIKLSYAWLEFAVTDLYEEDEPILVEIGQIILSVLREIDTELNQARSNYRCYAHIKFAPSDPQQFLAEHLGKGFPSELVPDAFAYQIAHNSQYMRAVVAKSSQYEHALFLDLSIEYQEADELSVMVDKINKDFEYVVRLLGLLPTKGT
jgi:hypothetical protein